MTAVSMDAVSYARLPSSLRCRCRRHGYKLTDDELLTVEEFIKLTENSYGGSVIRKLREAYGEEAT